ncbi:MAG: hypothetical protein QXU99_02425 [Candidatus Bathyarchaeia archaeon]
MPTRDMTRVKALALFSGGLDSILATRIILNQGITVEAIHFATPFGSCKNENKCGVTETAKQLGVPLRIVDLGNDYLRVVRNPRFGYGKHINPCVDCKIFMLKKAKKYAKQIGANFIFTGEVLGERPMSQHFKALRIIEEESGLKGMLLRPLSARLLPETFAEQKGLVKREQLLDISGRSRKPQIALAKQFGITYYPTPAGGCLLTVKEYAARLRDLFKHKKRISLTEVALLRVGRHFRFGKNKIIVGRNEAENKFLITQKLRSDYYFEVPDVGSPITLLQGLKTKKAIEVAAMLTAFYSDAKNDRVTVHFGRDRLEKTIEVSVPNRTTVESYKI